MVPAPDNTVSALLLSFWVLIQLLVAVGLIVLGYVGLSWALGRGVAAFTTMHRRRLVGRAADSASDN
ncbi:MAG: hypothetical protein QM598_00345 [Protaetiibacter sp.]